MANEHVLEFTDQNFEAEVEGTTSGLVVVDFATRKETRRITLPDPTGHPRETEGLQGSPAHGLAVTPDGTILWSTSKYYHAVMAYSLPDYKLLGVVEVGSALEPQPRPFCRVDA